MVVLWVMLVSIAVLAGAGTLYSRYLARAVGENPSRPTPAVLVNDGRDYVPSPTPVVFGHHFATIAGAGPIVGPVIAVVYGWVPALLWVLIGGVLVGAVHDYLALYMATREGGQSMAVIARRVFGKGAFLALMLFIVVMLVIVCAVFLNLSAQALMSRLPRERMPDLGSGARFFRILHEDGKEMVFIGGIASMSVVIMTVFAPLVGWMYIKKQVSVWKCSIAAIAISGTSIAVGLYYPISIPLKFGLLGWTIDGQDVWRVLLGLYTLVAAGVPVWIFLQSRDFINVHILYIGMGFLVLTLVVAGISSPSQADPLPAFNLEAGNKAMGWIWPVLFVTIACGAVSGFHSLCAGGTTCKQLKSEGAVRIGYFAMLLESFVAVCVIGTMLIGTTRSFYIYDIHPKTLGSGETDPNQVLGFAIAVGNAANIAWGLPVAFGALAGMILLEGFLITTLDTAVRFARYLLEEIWRTLFARYDVFAAPVGVEAAREWTGDEPPAGTEGIPVAIEPKEDEPAPATPIATGGPLRQLFTLIRHYWFNSGLAVVLILILAFAADVNALWKVFGTGNQLLAGMVLALASMWLLRRGRKTLFAFIPAVCMLVTTVTNLFLMVPKFAQGKDRNPTLLTADLFIIVITAYLLIVGIRAAAGYFRNRADAPVAK